MNDFYIAAYEGGAGKTAVPVWAGEADNPLSLEACSGAAVQRVEIKKVPGAFGLTGVLTDEECDRLVAQTEALGYTEDAAISLPRSVRHNENLVWIVDAITHDRIWERCRGFIEEEGRRYGGNKLAGLNRRFRFYKYKKGDFFKPHTDGAWPESRIIERKLVTDAKRFSRMTFLLFLSDGYSGGSTQFYLDREDGAKPAKSAALAELVEVRTPKGGVLCFPHGNDALHCLHSSAEVLSGVKYIIRSDILFETVSR